MSRGVQTFYWYIVCIIPHSFSMEKKTSLFYTSHEKDSRKLRIKSGCILAEHNKRNRNHKVKSTGKKIIRADLKETRKNWQGLKRNVKKNGPSNLAVMEEM